jgi:hypothetical protein
MTRKGARPIASRSSLTRISMKRIGRIGGRTFRFSRLSDEQQAVA